MILEPHARGFLLVNKLNTGLIQQGNAHLGMGDIKTTKLLKHLELLDDWGAASADDSIDIQAAALTLKGGGRPGGV